MSDRYLGFANSNLGRRLVDALGLPHPAPLERWQAGRLRPVEGALVIGGGPLTSRVEAIAPRLTDELYSFNAEGLQAQAWVAGLGPKLKAVVFDATHLSDSDELKQLREFFQPLLRSLAPCAHVVILGRAPESLDDPLASVAQRALEGFSRSLAKELRSCCISLKVPKTNWKTNWKVPCVFSSRPRARLFLARSCALKPAPARSRIGPARLAAVAPW